MGGRIITTVPVGFYTAPTDWGGGLSRWRKNALHA